MNDAGKKNILILVEGNAPDILLMQTLFKVYSELDAKHHIVIYQTSIYTLHQKFFGNNEKEGSHDLLLILREMESDPDKIELLNDKYTDFLLIFDLDPQDPQFTPDKIRQMINHFSDSTDIAKGKLYINYPMVEAFYHMKTIPDPKFLHRTVTIYELLNKTYKMKVNQESKGRDYRKFIAKRSECNTVILQNIEKAFRLLEYEDTPSPSWIDIDSSLILDRQLSFLENELLQVLCTCVFFVYDYDPRILFQ